MSFSPTKLLLVDRDGTITRNKIVLGGHINDPTEIELIPQAAIALQKYADDGWTIAVVSNQGGCEKGYISIPQCIEGFRRTMELAPMIQFCLFCSDATPPGDHLFIVGLDEYDPETFIHRFQNDNIGFRKPEPGMLWFAAGHVFGCFPVKYILNKCLYVGDRPEDEGAAKAANMPFMWAKDWWNSSKEVRFSVD